MFTSLPNGAVRVQHKELFRLVNSTTSFSILQNQINPGLPEIFTWLSQIAPSFEQYRWNYLCFHYRSTSSDNTSTINTALGVVMLGISYDSYDRAFTNRIEFTNYAGVRRCRPCDDMDYGASLSTRATQNMFVRTGPVPADADRRLYDLGTFNFATDAAQNANPVGELWVSYSIDLFKPKINEVGDAATARYTISGANASVPLGSTQTLQGVDEIGATLTSNTITFPGQSALPNQYIVIVNWTGTAGLGTTYPTLTGTNCTIGTVAIGPTAGTASGDVTLVFNVTVTDPMAQSVVTVGVAGVLPTNFTGSIRIIDTFF